MNDNGHVLVLLLLGLAALALVRKKWRGSGDAHGTASWATLKQMVRAGMLAGNGLILGRHEEGQLLRIPAYTHLMAVAPTGSGKGVSLVVPNLLDYDRGSCFIWDPKGENYRLTAEARQALGQSVILLDPFGVTGEPSACFNPLDLIEPGPRLIDSARALAEAIGGAARSGREADPHWIESAVAVIQGLTVFVLMRFDPAERNLNSICELAADPALFSSAVEQLRSMGGIPGRLGNYLSGLRDKELSSVLSTTNRALACFSSELVASMLARSSFDARAILCPDPGTTIYFVLPQDQLQAQKGTLRLVVSSLLQLVLRSGVQSKGECLFLLDECASLGKLDDLEQALVLGRGSGIRLFSFWQSSDQARSVFEDKPGLFEDNSSVQVYFGASGYENAERISKMLGESTWVVESYSHNEGDSYQRQGGNPEGIQRSYGTGMNYSEIGRPLLRPEEVLTLSGDYLIAFVRNSDVPPILARRVKWYEDDLSASGPLRLRWKRWKRWKKWIVIGLILTGLAFLFARSR